MKKFIVRDRYGYVIYVGDEALSPSRLKSLFNLSEEASLEYAQGSWGWESEEDWCRCGDWDCIPRTANGGDYCPCRRCELQGACGTERCPAWEEKEVAKSV